MTVVKNGWQTTDDATPAFIGSTFSLGGPNPLSSIMHFGTYPSFKTLFLPSRASLAEYLAYVERSTVWQEVL